MYSSKLVDVFYSLDKSQLRALRKFVRSPFFNKRLDVIELTDHMYHTPLVNRDALRKEVVFSKLFPGEKYSADKVDYTMSFLNKLIEQFLVYQHATREKLDQQLALLEEYRHLGLKKHFNQILNTSTQQLEKYDHRNIQYHERAFAIELERYQFLAKEQRDADKNLEALSHKLDVLFLSRKLKDGCRLLAHQAVAKRQYDFGLLESLLPYIERTPGLLKYSSVALYYYYYRAATDKEQSEHYYLAFKEVFAKEAKRYLEEEEVRDLYTLALNYCIRRINLGNADYQKELFEWYQMGLESKLLIDDGRLNPFKFNNIVKLALRIGKIKWTEDFIKGARKLLDPSDRSMYVHNAYCMLFFAKGHYEETLKHLQRVEYKDLFIALDSKILLIKVYYHLDEYEALENYIGAVKKFLQRKDILAYHREMYKGFLRLVQKLVRLPPFDKVSKQRLRKEIEQTDRLLERNWLLEQLA